MSTKELIYKTLSLMTALSNLNDNPYNDIMMMYDERLMSYSVSLVSEIIELLDGGYSYDEIKELILECDFVKIYPELAKEEGEYLRKDALKMLDIRYQIYMEDKNIKKKIK